jgi:hypothetical protein
VAGLKVLQLSDSDAKNKGKAARFDHINGSLFSLRSTGRICNNMMYIKMTIKSTTPLPQFEINARGGSTGSRPRSPYEYKYLTKVVAIIAPKKCADTNAVILRASTRPSSRYNISQSY